VNPINGHIEDIVAAKTWKLEATTA